MSAFEEMRAIWPIHPPLSAAATVIRSSSTERQSIPKPMTLLRSGPVRVTRQAIGVNSKGVGARLRLDARETKTKGRSFLSGPRFRRLVAQLPAAHGTYRS